METFVSADIFVPFALFYAWPKWTCCAQRPDRTRAIPIGLGPCPRCPLWVPLQRPSGRGRGAVATKTGSTREKGVERLLFLRPLKATAALAPGCCFSIELVPWAGGGCLMPGTGGVGRGARMNEYEPWQSVKQDASHQQDTRHDSAAKSRAGHLLDGSSAYR